MHRRLWLIPAFAGLLAASACSKKADTAADTAATTTAAPAVQVTSVDLGPAVGADNHVTGSTDTFQPNQTVYAAVSTDGTSPNATLTARWTYQDGQVVDSSARSIAPTGPAVTEFHVSKPSGWPKGDYKVEVMLNGASVQTKSFKVK